MATALPLWQKRRKRKMSNEQILADLKKSVETWDIKLAQTATQAAIDAKIDIGTIIGDGLGKGMEVIGDRFDKAEIYLPQVVAASKTMEAALKVLEPLMTAGAGALKGTVIMGTVEGDIHEIGKNVCCAMLRGAGYKVIPSRRWRPPTSASSEAPPAARSGATRSVPTDTPRPQTRSSSWSTSSLLEGD